MSETQTEKDYIEPGEEVSGDKAPVLRPAEVSQVSAEYKPFDPFGGSTVLTSDSPIYLGQLRQEIAEAVGAAEGDVQVSYSTPSPEAPVSKGNEAHVFVKVKGHSVNQKTLAKVLAEHRPANAPVDPAAPDTPPLPVQPLDGDAAALADKARAGETLSTKELSSLLGALLA